VKRERNDAGRSPADAKIKKDEEEKRVEVLSRLTK
jgi:hypothetical protein